MIARAIRVARMLLCVCTVIAPLEAAAADRYALLVTGAAGGPEYQQKYQAWVAQFVATLADRLGYQPDHIITLAEGDRRAPTRENVRTALSELARRTAADDVVLVLLVGHGTGGGSEAAKFNLVGPDMSAEEWAAAVQPVAGRLVFVNAASGSFPFLRAIAKPGRIVITATGLAQQEYETVFPQFFVEAFAAASADTDKNGKVSLWEAFTVATAGVKRWYEERGQLPTERAMLDDTGDGLGREAEEAVAPLDGAIAQVTYLKPDAVIAATPDSALGGLLRRRTELQSAIDLLRARKPNLPEVEYETALERLLIEIARLDRDIRASQP